MVPSQIPRRMITEAGRVAASSNEAAGLLARFQIQNHKGPCLDCCSAATSCPFAHAAFIDIPATAPAG